MSLQGSYKKSSTFSVKSKPYPKDKLLLPNIQSKKISERNYSKPSFLAEQSSLEYSIEKSPSKEFLESRHNDSLIKAIDNHEISKVSFKEIEMDNLTSKSCHYRLKTQGNRSKLSNKANIHDSSLYSSIDMQLKEKFKNKSLYHNPYIKTNGEKPKYKTNMKSISDSLSISDFKPILPGENFLASLAEDNEEKSKIKLLKYMSDMEEVLKRCSEVKIQQISTPSEREDVIALSQWVVSMLNNLSSDKNATTQASFEKLQLIYIASIQELVRQITINCKERGNLLLNLWNSYMEVLDNGLKDLRKKGHRMEVDYHKKAMSIHKIYQGRIEDMTNEMTSVKENLKDSFEKQRDIHERFEYIKKKFFALAKENDLRKNEGITLKMELSFLSEDNMRLRRIMGEHKIKDVGDFKRRPSVTLNNESYYKELRNLNEVANEIEEFFIAEACIDTCDLFTFEDKAEGTIVESVEAEINTIITAIGKEIMLVEERIQSETQYDGNDFCEGPLFFDKEVQSEYPSIQVSQEEIETHNEEIMEIENILEGLENNKVNLEKVEKLKNRLKEFKELIHASSLKVTSLESENEILRTQIAEIQMTNEELKDEVSDREYRLKKKASRLSVLKSRDLKNKNLIHSMSNQFEQLISNLINPNPTEADPRINSLISMISASRFNIEDSSKNQSKQEFNTEDKDEIMEFKTRKQSGFVKLNRLKKPDSHESLVHSPPESITRTKGKTVSFFKQASKSYQELNDKSEEEEEEKHDSVISEVIDKQELNLISPTSSPQKKRIFEKIKENYLPSTLDANKKKSTVFALITKQIMGKFSLGTGFKNEENDDFYSSEDDEINPMRSSKRSETVKRDIAMKMKRQERKYTVNTDYADSLLKRVAEKVERKNFKPSISKNALMKAISAIFMEKLKSYHNDNLPFHVLIYELFIMKYGLRKVAESKFTQVLETAFFYKMIPKISSFVSYSRLKDPKWDTSKYNFYFRLMKDVDDKSMGLSIASSANEKIIVSSVAMNLCRPNALKFS